MFPKKRELALEALDRREYAAAERGFTALLEAGELTRAERAFLLNKRGVARVGLERRALARDDFTAALDALGSYAPALTNLGNLLLESGQVDAAIVRYKAAIAGDRAYALAYLNLGVAYKRAGRIAEAVEALRQAQRLEHSPNAASWRRSRR
jgi:lipoprotein NlpI